jgi:general secretion pathway protein B
MSSILKALRKLEEEKAALGEGGIDISRDILKRSARKQQGYNFWPLVSGVLFLLLVSFAVLFWSNERPVSDVLQTNTAPISAPSVARAPDIKSRPLPAEVTSTKKASPVPPVSEVPPSVKVATPIRVQVEPEALRPSGLPFLKLSGIAYREKAVERIAIINDLPVMQGTAIEGAQLLEILPDRVVLSWQGASFDLQLEDENR